MCVSSDIEYRIRHFAVYSDIEYRIRHFAVYSALETVTQYRSRMHRFSFSFSSSLCLSPSLCLSSILPLLWLRTSILSSYFILSYLILSYLSWSFFTLSDLISSYLISVDLILPYLLSSYLILSFISLSYFTLSDLISSYLILFYLILFYLISSYFISSYFISSHLISSHLILSYLSFLLLFPFSPNFSHFVFPLLSSQSLQDLLSHPTHSFRTSVLISYPILSITYWSRQQSNSICMSIFQFTLLRSWVGNAQTTLFL